jgi:hypothetical protein
MSDPVIKPKEISPTRFFTYVGLGLLALILSIFALGSIMTHFMWPPQEKLSRPVSLPEQ